MSKRFISEAIEYPTLPLHEYPAFSSTFPITIDVEFSSMNECLDTPSLDVIWVMGPS